jgi:citronellol/citronellal dehydrogenase
MTMLTLGVAERYREEGVAANCLWPRTTIATAAVQNIIGGDAAMAVSRRPEIMADAAHEVLTQPAREYTAQTLIDDDVLRASGMTDFAAYRYEGATEEQLQSDIFLG